MDATKTAAGAAAGAMVNTSASAKAAVDINDECLRRLSDVSQISVPYEYLLWARPD